MAGNEIEVCRFLLSNLGKVSLNHIGQIVEMAAPIAGSDRCLVLHSEANLDQISTSDAKKKADIYLNAQGVSVKQKGGSFSFNRLQRKNLLALYKALKFSDPEAIIRKMDQEVDRFHQDLLPSRNQSWRSFFTEQEFKTLLEFLMLKGSPNLGLSYHPAQFILEAPKVITTGSDLTLYQLDEYFAQYQENLTIAIRRQWIGQQSESEHRRALSLCRSLDNLPWVFDDIVGEPKTGWRDSFPETERKTVYFLMIEKKS
jgi:hypothetical protein